MICFVDCHYTHMTLDASEYCCTQQIILYCLQAKATQLIRAADFDFFLHFNRLGSLQSRAGNWVNNNAIAYSNNESLSCCVSVRLEESNHLSDGYHWVMGNSYSVKIGLIKCPDGVDKTRLGPLKVACVEPKRAPKILTMGLRFIY